MAKALWHLSDSSSVIKATKLPAENSNSCIVKTAYSLISTGTERLVSLGLVPESLHSQMKVPYMQGKFSFPLTYGYSMVGRVISEQSTLFGKLVHFMHPHQDICHVEASSLFEIPENIPATRAGLASNVETALNAIWDSGLSIGDRTLVCGFGMIGALVARLLSFMPGVEVQVLEIDPGRKKKAKEMGFEVVENPEQEQYDLAFHTSASAGGLQKCIDSVGLEGKIIELSWYGTKSIALQLGGSFHRNRKQLISSQVSIIPKQKSARWDYKRRKETVFELLKNDIFDQHISHIIPFEDTPDFFQKLRTDKLEGLGYLIKY